MADHPCHGRQETATTELCGPFYETNTRMDFGVILNSAQGGFNGTEDVGPPGARLPRPPAAN